MTFNILHLLENYLIISKVVHHYFTIGTCILRHSFNSYKCILFALLVSQCDPLSVALNISRTLFPLWKSGRSFKLSSQIV
jgi:hypothetical protein